MKWPKAIMRTFDGFCNYETWEMVAWHKPAMLDIAGRVLHDWYIYDPASRIDEDPAGATEQITEALWDEMSYDLDLNIHTSKVDWETIAGEIGYEVPNKGKQ